MGVKVGGNLQRPLDILQVTFRRRGRADQAFHQVARPLSARDLRDEFPCLCCLVVRRRVHHHRRTMGTRHRGESPDGLKMGAQPCRGSWCGMATVGLSAH
ncbi:hypothetical protein [Ornithinimicrobium kibberense]|uniref:hypothetical protein n=1 Tax=Ornithinimicrobium kibberense TaxID=282060 RepID=UPI00361A24DF